MMAKKPNGYWTKDRCKESALCFETSTAWQRGEGSAYTIARRNGWGEECCNHMVSPQKANGYWSLNQCKKSAAEFSTRMGWKHGDMAAYTAATKKGWLDVCCSHMTQLIKPAGYWTLELCRESALRFDTREDWSVADGAAVAAAYKNNWSEECSKHMTSVNKPRGYWTIDRCQESASRFETRTAWQKGETGAYDAASKNNWVDICCTHMGCVHKPTGYWTADRCKESASQFKTTKEWRDNDLGAYKAASKNGWLDLCRYHMEWLQKPNGYWTLVRCATEALKYETRSEFRSGCGAASIAAFKNGWLDDVCGHMERSVFGFNPTKPGVLYYLRVEAETGPLWKIGITNLSIKERFSASDRDIITEIRTWDFPVGADAYAAEQEILNKFDHLKYNGPDVLTNGGNTELFTRDVLGIDSERLAA